MKRIQIFSDPFHRRAAQTQVFALLSVVLMAGCQEEIRGATSAATSAASTGTTLQGTASSPATPAQVLGSEQYWDDTGALQTGTMPLGAPVNGGAGELSFLIPQGYYDGTLTATALDTNLTANNIVTGKTIFGVSGSATGPYSSCTDNALNAAQCSTAASRYVATAAGNSVSGANGSLSMTIPQGYYSGAQTATASDTNLVTGNIIAGVSIFGVSGGLANNGTWNLTQSFATAGGAGYYGAVSNAPSATNICSSTTILGVAGLATCGGVILASYEHRDASVSQISLPTEVVTDAATSYTNATPYGSSTGYRAVPDINKDDDGYTGGSVTGVNRTGWGATTCGTSGIITARIASCVTAFGANATWNGATSGNAGQGTWKLVTRTGAVNGSLEGSEVWQDQTTGQMWSSLVATAANWCKASGSNDITGNPTAQVDPSGYCNSSSYQNTTGLAVSACFEDGGTSFTQTDATITNNTGGKGGLGYSSTPKVGWRLPNAYDYHQAEVDGIRFVMPDMIPVNNYEWSASVYSSIRSLAWFFYGANGVVNITLRFATYGVRCVGR
jgi:hypothetical protein